MENKITIINTVVLILSTQILVTYNSFTYLFTYSYHHHHRQSLIQKNWRTQMFEKTTNVCPKSKKNIQCNAVSQWRTKKKTNTQI